MWLRLPVAVLLLGAVFAVGPLAYASPPDPTWIAGVYDDADYDDVVVAVSSLQTGPALEPVVVTPYESHVWDVPQVAPAVVAVIPPPVASIRAPPIA